MPNMKSILFHTAALSCWALVWGCTPEKAESVVLGVAVGADVVESDLAPSDVPVATDAVGDGASDGDLEGPDLDAPDPDLGDNSPETHAELPDVVEEVSINDSDALAEPEGVGMDADADSAQLELPGMDADADSAELELPGMDGDADSAQLELPAIDADAIDGLGADAEIDAPYETVEAPVCLASEVTCLLGVPATCGEAKQGWVSLESCKTNQVCKVGKCITMVCEPNAKACSGSVVISCAPDGLNYLPGGGDCAAAGLVCAAGKCVQEPCGNGKVEVPEACDDGNKTSGDGCSSICQSEWKTIIDEDFSPPPSNWTACAGCSGGGCPNSKSGALVSGGDWTRVCLPLPDLTKLYLRIRFEFTVHGEAPLGAFWLAAGPVDIWDKQSPRVTFDAAGQGVTLGGENAKPIGLLNFLPEMPFTAQFVLEIDTVSGGVWVGINGQALQSLGSVGKVQSGPWVWNVATNYSCCNGSLTGTWLDDFKAFGVPLSVP